MAELTNQQIIAALGAAEAIGARPTRAVKVAVAIRRLLRALRPLAEDVQAGVQRLADEHVEKDGEGKMIPMPGGAGFKLREDARDEYHRRFKELMEAVAPVEVWVTPDHFDGVEITGAELAALGDLLRDAPEGGG